MMKLGFAAAIVMGVAEAILDPNNFPEIDLD